MMIIGEVQPLRSLSFTLPRATPLLNVTLRTHWAKRRQRNRNLAWDVKVALGAQRIAPPFARARVTIRRYSIGTPDRDGLIGGMKGLIDALLVTSKRHPYGLSIIADDSPACMELIALSEKAETRAAQRTEVLIEELESIA